MIKFRCTKCAEVMSEKDALIGQKVRCSACGKLLTVPAPKKKLIAPVVEDDADFDTAGLQDMGAFDLLPEPDPVTAPMEEDPAATQAAWTRSDTKDAVNAEAKRKLLLAGVGVAVLLVGVVAVWMAVRDTWEADNRDEIVARFGAAANLEASGQFEQAEEKYRQAFQFVGEHELEDPALKKILQQARTSMAGMPACIAAKKAEAFYAQNRATIDSALAGGDALLAVGKTDEAVASYQKAIDACNRGPSLHGKLKELAALAARKQTRARAAAATASLAAAKDMVTRANAARSKKEFTRAKALYEEAVTKIVAAGLAAGAGNAVLVEARAGLAGVKTLAAEQERLAAAAKDEQEKERLRREAEKARLAEKKAAEAEAARKQELTRKMLEEQMAPWKSMYAAVEKIHGRCTSKEDCTADDVKGMAKEITALTGALPPAGPGDVMQPARQSATEILECLVKYRGALQEPMDTTNKTMAKIVASKRMRYRTDLATAANLFAYQVYQRLADSKLETSFVSAEMRLAGQAEFDRRCTCKHCQGTMAMHCPDCLVKGMPSGKALCTACKGRGVLMCTVCNGAGSSQCASCQGKRKIAVGSGKTSAMHKDTKYVRCPMCDGAAWTHPRKTTRTIRHYRSYYSYTYITTHTHAGQCPGCRTNNPKGHVPCTTCKRTGRSGTCPTCQGKKKVPCIHCEKGRIAPAP